MSDYGGQHRTVTLTGWSSGTGFGLSVGAEDRRRVFKRLKQRMGGGLHIELPGVDETGCSQCHGHVLGRLLRV